MKLVKKIILLGLVTEGILLGYNAISNRGLKVGDFHTLNKDGGTYHIIDIHPTGLDAILTKIGSLSYVEGLGFIPDPILKKRAEAEEIAQKEFKKHIPNFPDTATIAVDRSPNKLEAWIFEDKESKVIY